MSAYTDSFNDDYKKLWDNGAPGADLQAYLDSWKDYQDSVEAYHKAMQRLAHTSDASVAFTMLMWLMSNEGCDQQQALLASDASALKLQGDLTKLNNDIEDKTNQNDPSSQYVIDVAKHLDAMMDLLKNPDLQNAVGTEATNALSEQFKVLRWQIHWNGETNPDYNPPSGYTYYFDPDNSKYIQNYAELQNDLSARGDPKNANEAEKQKTDAFNENTSTTQSTNAASQEKISNDSNMLKAVQAFATDGFHAIMDLISAAVKATKPS